MRSGSKLLGLLFLVLLAGAGGLLLWRRSRSETAPAPSAGPAEAAESPGNQTAVENAGPAGKAEVRTQAPPQGAVLLDAEEGQVTSPMVVLDDPGAAGGRCVEVPRGTPRESRGKGGIAWRTRVAKAGTYTLWGRVWWPDDCGNSFYVVVNGAGSRDFGNDGTHRVWHWVGLTGLNLGEGQHTIEFRYREDGARLDQILFTPDANQIPVGAYRRSDEAGGLVSAGAESDLLLADSFGRTAAAGLAPWEKASGEWGIDSTADPNGVPNFFAVKATGDGPALLLAGYDFWKDYRVSAVVRPVREGGVGLIVACLGKDRMVRASLEPGGDGAVARLVRVTPEGEKTLGEARARLWPRSWTRLEVRAAAGSAWGGKSPARREDTGRIEFLVDGEPVLDIPAPWLGSGKAGLWAGKPGEGAWFDRVAIRAPEVFREPPVGADGSGWLAGNAGWLIAADGRWADREVSMAFTPGAGSTVEIALGEEEKDRIVAALGAEGVRIVSRSKDGEKELAKGPPVLGRGVRAALRLRSIEGRVVLDAETGPGVGERLSAWAAADLRRLAVRVAGDPVAWERFESRQFARDEDAHVVAACSLRTNRVQSMSDFEGLLSDEDIEAINRSRQKEFLRRVPEYHGVVGQLWGPRSGSWRVQGGALTGYAQSGAQGSIWAAERMSASGALEVRFRLSPGAAAGIALATEDLRKDRSVFCRVGATDAVLNAGGEEAMRAPASAAPNAWHSLRLSRRCGWVVAVLDGRPVAAAREPEGFPCRWGLLAAGGTVQFTDAVLTACDGTDNSACGAFEDPEPDWTPAEGEWPIHQGIACIWASTWVCARPAKGGGAVLWNKRAFGPETTIAIEAFEYSEWYGWDRDPSHCHFPYGNVGFVLAAEYEDLASGYAVAVCGWDHTRTCIFRRGQIVASLAHDGRFPVQKVPPGNHIPLNLRAAACQVEMKGGTLRVLVQGTEVLKYTDPEPLRGSRVGLWTWGAPLNLRLVNVAPAKAGPPAHVLSLCGKPGPTVRAFLEAARLKM